MPLIDQLGSDVLEPPPRAWDVGYGEVLTAPIDPQEHVWIAGA